MLRYGTKDPYERETEETERLVRESPKVKPPRRDLRRETVEPDRDQDLSSADPDMSKNFKDIGGSVARRWLERQAGDRKDLVKVRQKDTGHVTYVTPETLKEKGGEYEVADDEEEGSSKKYPVKEEGSPPPSDRSESHSEEKPDRRTQEKRQLDLYRQVQEAIQDDPAFETLSKSIADPKISIGQLPNDFPIDKLKGFSDTFPALKPFKTMGEARQAIHGAKNLKNLEKKFQEKWGAPPADEKKQDQPLAEAGAKIREQAENDPALKAVVEQLDGGDPRALLHLRHKINPSEDASKVVPGLPPEVKTLGDVVDALEATKPGSPSSEAPKEKPEKEPQAPAETSPKDVPEDKPTSDPIGEPSRRSTTPLEEDRAKRQIIDAFPVEVAEKLLDAEPPIHPDDVRDLLEVYHTAKSHGKDEDLVRLVRKGGYNTDLNAIHPPVVGVNKSGEEVPFEQLSGEEKGNTLRKHQMFVLALSLAARDRVVANFEKKTKAPEELLGTIADFTLHQAPDESQEERSARALRDAKHLFAGIVKNGLIEGGASSNSRWQSDSEPSEQDEGQSSTPGVQAQPPKELSASQIQKVLDLLKNDPAAQHLVVGYGHAVDFLTAQHKFLDPRSSDSISEHQTPKEIVKRLQEADSFFDEASKKYPEELQGVPSGKDQFRHQLVGKIKEVAPEKYPLVKSRIEELEFDAYEKSLKEWGTQYEEYQKALKKRQRKKQPYRSDEDAPVFPEPPKRPDGYLQSRGSKKELEGKGSGLLDRFRRSIGIDEADKKASQIWRVSHRYSSCKTLGLMGPRSKEGVYWGVAPYPKEHEGVQPYHGWQQARNQNLSESDLSKILASARTWLQTPMLSDAIEGVYRDTQLRAALDLSLRSCEDGRYSEGVHPTLYNRLLARLGGTPEGETLLTERGSLYASGDTRPMKHSQQLRALASRVASQSPHVAFDMVELAAKFAQDEQQQSEGQNQEQKQGGQVPPEFLEHQKKKDDQGQGQQGQQEKQASAYRELRSVVIRMAHANPSLREAYAPMLDTIKKLG